MAPTTDADHVTLASFQDPSLDVERLLFPEVLSSRAPDDAPLSRGELESLISHLSRMQARLREVHQSAEQQLAHTRQDFEEQRVLMLEAHAALQQRWASASALLQEAQAKSLQLTQVATKCGNRLQTALLEKDRATAAIRQLNHLATFAHAPSIAALPALFHDETRQGEAAAIAKTLLRLTREVVDGMRSSQGTLGPAVQGSVQAAMQRVMVAAAQGSETPGAAEKLLVQRYISTRPMFTDPSVGRGLLGDDGPAVGTVASAAQGTDTPAPATTPAELLRSLQLTYKSLLQCVIAEAGVLEQVFVAPGDAAAALVTRVFEQRVQAAVHSVLSAPGPDAVGATGLRARLVLLRGVVRITRKLAEDLQEVLGGHMTLLNELAEAATASFTACYLEDELDWLDLQFAEATATITLQSLEPFMSLLAAHAEAMERAVDLAPGPALPETIRALVGADGCADGGDETGAVPPPLPTLLGQCGGFLARGLRVGAESLPQALSGASTLAAAMELVRAHVTARVLPSLAGSPGDARACVSACAAMQARLDAEATATLRSALAGEARELGRKLLTRQDAGEFDPEGTERRAVAAASSYWAGAPTQTRSATAPGERPTPACVHACAHVRGLLQAIATNLHGANAVSAGAAVGRAVASTLLAHRSRFRFSPLGAVAWRRDLQEYRAVLSGTAGGVQEIEAMQADCAALLVDPAALPGVLQAAAGVGGRDRVLETIKLRADWDAADSRWRALLLD